MKERKYLKLTIMLLRTHYASRQVTVGLVRALRRRIETPPVGASLALFEMHLTSRMNHDLTRVCRKRTSCIGQLR